jgi:uncharacterized protein
MHRNALSTQGDVMYQLLKYAIATACGLLAIALIVTGADAAPSLKITVYGGSGRIGQAIVAEALSRGHQVTVVARDPSTLTVSSDTLTVASGDVMDTDAVAKQIAGQDVVISAIGRGHGQVGGDELLVKTARSLVSAQRSLGAKAPRLIVVGSASAFGESRGVTAPSATPATGMAPMATSPAGAEAQKLALDYYRTVTDAQWTYVSPPQHIDPGARTGKYRISETQLVRDAQGESRISREDYAVAMIDEAEKPMFIRKRFTVGY